MENHYLTEFGFLPNTWKIGQFSDFADKGIRWSITGGPFGSDLKMEDYTNEGVQIIQLQNIGDGTFNDNYKIFTSKEKADKLISCNIFPEDLILSKMGDPVARVCYVPNTADRFVMASDGIRLVVDEKKFNKKFVHDYINSNNFRKRAITVSTGSTRQRIGLPELKKIKVIIPPLTEQKAIADCLSTWDDAIEKQTKLIAAKEQRKKALMQQLLSGKKRLQGFTETWKNYTLGSLGSTFNGLTGKNKEDFGEGQPFITYLNIFQNPVIDISTFDLVKINLGERQNRVKYGDIFFTVSSETQDEVGMASVLLQDVEDLYLNSFCFGYRLHNFDTLLPEFSSYFFRAYNFRKELFKLSQGATRYNLSKNNLMLVEISVPNVKEQKLISDILFTAEKEISAEKIRLVNFKRQKKALMQNLLSGKVRLVS